jgi:hypothetical protein
VALVLELFADAVRVKPHLGGDLAEQGLAIQALEESLTRSPNCSK